MGNYNLVGANTSVPEDWYKFRVAKAGEKTTPDGKPFDQYDCILVEGLESGKKFTGFTLKKKLWESDGGAPMNAKFLGAVGAEGLKDSNGMYKSEVVHIKPQDYIGQTFWAQVTNKEDPRYGIQSDINTYSKERPEEVVTTLGRKSPFADE